MWVLIKRMEEMIVLKFSTFVLNIYYFFLFHKLFLLFLNWKYTVAEKAFHHYKVKITVWPWKLEYGTGTQKYNFYSELKKIES
jgi:hypothetical protein